MVEVKFQILCLGQQLFAIGYQGMHFTKGSEIKLG
jgi:hypothetical protein